METKTKTQNPIQGLSSAEAARRLKRYGPNTVYKKPRLRPLLAFLGKFQSPLLLILIVSSLISIFLGQRTSAVIILVMVFISAVLDFVNSYRSQRAVEELNSRVVTTVTVVRDGQKREIELHKIVPGDAILLAAGDIVPADCELLEARDFFVNQAILTGESYPVEKFADSGDKAVFMGTSVVTGYGTAVITKTASTTEFGKIAARLAERPPLTDFEKGIRQFSIFIMRVTVVLVAFVFLTNAFLGRGVLQSFIFAVAIAVGLTPELLPVIMSVALSRGSLLMAKKDVIVKRLPAIQNFGSMNILCTDKTGTLTENRIELVKHVDGLGQDSEAVLLYSYLTAVFHTGVATPLDAAIKAYKTLDTAKYQKIDEIPFDFERKRSSMVVQRSDKRTLICKGAPEDIFAISKHYWQGGRAAAFSPALRQKILAHFTELSHQGFRVLGVAIKHEQVKAAGEYSKTEERDLIFVGFVAFLDPPKQTATQAVQELEKLGVEVKILTGDSEILTQKICADIKIPVKGTLTGAELARLDDAALLARIPDVTIFARLDPEQKEHIILSLRKLGNVVGYLGDGINDAPALQAADVGISVNNAVDVAKETADIILLKKSLRVLRDGVAEGRKTFSNTLKYIMMGLSSNFGNMFSMSIMPLFLNFLPMLPSQILFNNFLYDVSQLTLAGDRVDEGDIERPPRWSFKFITKYMLVFGPVSSVFDFLTVGLLAFVFQVSHTQFRTGWFMESLATQIFVIYVIRTKKIPFLQSRPSLALLFNTALVVLVGWVIPLVFLGRILGFSPLPGVVIWTLVGIVFAYLVLAQLVKVAFYRRLGLSQSGKL